jgi:hypothetical protein
MRIVVTPPARDSAPGKLADAELWFTDGPLAGLLLTGFALWDWPKRGTADPHVTFPSRQYGPPGQRKSFALLRPQPETDAGAQIRTLILDAYRRIEERHHTHERHPA